LQSATPNITAEPESYVKASNEMDADPHSAITEMLSDVEIGHLVDLLSNDHTTLDVSGRNTDGPADSFALRHIASDSATYNIADDESHSATAINVSVGAPTDILLNKVAVDDDTSGRVIGALAVDLNLVSATTSELQEVLPNASSSVSFVPDAGTTRVDGLIYGTKWGGAVGTGVTVEYSFPTDGAIWTVNYGAGSEPYSGFVPLSPNQQNAARKALQCWDEVCNINFVEVADTSTNAGDLRFANSDVPQTAWAYYPTTDPRGGDIWFGKAHDYNSDVDGTYSLAAFIHEIGHAIGLKHPHDSGGSGVVLPIGEDYLGNSIMSYRSYIGASTWEGWSNSFFPTTPGVLDIAALQYMYGADTTTRAGNSTYSWTPGEQLFETIWDAGGIDLIDWANQSTPAEIRLSSGVWSKLGPGYATSGGFNPETLNIAHGCMIENARGGSASDKLYGNTAANDLSGQGGNDFCYGESGNDTLSGNDGNDFLSGQNGTDRFVGGRGKDTVNGGAGNDIYDFDAAMESAVGANRDVVQSFHNPGNLSGDRFDFFDIDANVATSGNQALFWRGTSAFNGPGQLRVFNSNSNTIVAGSTDADYLAEFEIAITDGSFTASSYSAADFIL
jgi:Ca2+-binding RTX toxin-like protein